MESIEILTGQHVTIEYKSASVGQRILAMLLDVVFQVLYGITIYFIFEKTFKKSDFWEDDQFVVILTLLSIPIIFYHFLFESLLSGQTPGKIVTKIKVTNVDGSVSGIGSYFLRWLLLPIDWLFFGFTALFTILITKNSQRIGDLAAGTTVIKVAPKEPAITHEFYNFGSNYTPYYPQVEKLTPGQISLITGILEIPPIDDGYGGEDESLLKLSSKVQTFLDIRSSSAARDFLVTVVRDYNYYATLGY